MNRKILKLSKSLYDSNFNKESENVLNILRKAKLSAPLEQWKSVYEEATKPIPPQFVGRAVKYLVSGATGLFETSQKLEGLSEEELKQVLELAEQFPEVKTQAGYNFKQIKKLAKEFDNRFPKDGHIKSAQLDWAKNLIGGGINLGGKALKLIPYVGVIFSGMLAFKNFMYGFWEYSKLKEESKQIGLTWLDTLYPVKIEAKVQEYQDNPEKLEVTSRVSKSAKLFVDEGISFVANFIDAIKDLIFFFLSTATFGLATVGDIGISLIIAAIEWQAENQALAPYSNILKSIANLAQNKINEITRPMDWSNMSEEDIAQYFGLV